MKWNNEPKSTTEATSSRSEFTPKIIKAPAEASVSLRVGGPDLSESAVWAESDNSYGDAATSPPTFSGSRVWVEKDNFYGPGENDEAILIIGFDTEFVSPDALTRLEIQNGMGRYEVLSYQTWCKLYDGRQPAAVEWGGICYPSPDRLTIAEVITFTIWKGIQSGALKKVPLNIYLTGHFTRADVPAFADFKTLLDNMSALRGTFISLDDYIPLTFEFGEQVEPVGLRIRLRDTMTLSPQSGGRSLRALGDLVGVPKVTLDPDAAREQHYKENMDQLLAEKPDLFERYALTDSVICVRYMDKILILARSLLGPDTKPHVTLTGIGVDLLTAGWEREGPGTVNEMLGMETVRKKRWNNRRKKYSFYKETVLLPELDLHRILATEAYHGGRAEQFWFGPGVPANWTDYDLAGAYPTAMARIRQPDWRKVRFTLDVADYTADTLGVAWVSFKFPASVRFPTMPVRTDHGMIFPRQGKTYCGAPEIALAVELGAEIVIHNGVVIPPLNDKLVFGEFIKTCTANRKAQLKGSIYELFWKELTNSTYGKTAQGLQDKRVYDLREQKTKRLPPSRITQPFYAAFITSFVRATLGEVLNRLPSDVTVFSCTTDGFLTDANPKQIADAQQGTFGQLYGQARGDLTGLEVVLEAKHEIKQPLGWRTRGQATLEEGRSDKGDGFNIVLAKGGIFTASSLDSTRLQNGFIVELFLNRTPDRVIQMTPFAGIRYMVENDVDLVRLDISRRLNMEFDWKRRPYRHGVDEATGHVWFSTQPWDSIAQFHQVRGYWDEAIADKPFCMTTADDFRSFANLVLSKSSLTSDAARYLSRKAPDIKRLRQCLCRAWRHSGAGLVWQQSPCATASELAKILDAVGIPCTRADVENSARKKDFLSHQCPDTPAVRAALCRLASELPGLQIDQIICDRAGGIDFTGETR